MIIAIDESGDFRKDSKKFSFVVAAHIRQNKILYLKKMNHFFNWETKIPKRFKNHKGEIKSSLLDDYFLEKFVYDVLISEYFVGLTIIRMLPKENPKNILDKHKKVQLKGIKDGIIKYRELNKEKHSLVYNDFYNWLNKLSYEQYLKIITLGHCIVDSFRNTIGMSISSGYDDELPELRFVIDNFNLKGREQNSFWHEILRNQLYAYTLKNPIPLLDEWRNKGHPFISKYASKGYFDLNNLFWNNVKFVESKDYFEIRIADAVGTILNRYYNEGSCTKCFLIVKKCILGDSKIKHIVFNDFDLEKN